MRDADFARLTADPRVRDWAMDWYRQQAEEHGESALSLLHVCTEINESGIEAAVAWAREAMHYARLVERFAEFINGAGA